jgi:hypothetical protein
VQCLSWLLFLTNIAQQKTITRCEKTFMANSELLKITKPSLVLKVTDFCQILGDFDIFCSLIFIDI